MNTKDLKNKTNKSIKGKETTLKTIQLEIMI